MDNVETQATLRDTLESSFDTVTATTEAIPIVETLQVDNQEEKEQRARDEAGRFAKQGVVNASIPDPNAPKPAETPEIAVAPSVPRPSSWKKDFDPHWDKFDPEVKNYILQREREYANGVSTYKSEAENARQLNEAIAPFMPDLQRNGIAPDKFIQNLGYAHQRLAMGSPQEKVQMGVKLIQDYGIDPQALFQVLSGQQPQYQPQQYQQPQQQPVDIAKIVEQKLTEKEVTNEYQRFIAEAPEKYPHFEEVKGTMAGLLQAELAQDYESAYKTALRLPKHAAIFDAIQQQEREKTEASLKAKAQAAVGSARAKAVSVKSSTPSGQMSPVNGSKGLRESLSEAFDAYGESRV
tara:strand:- start:2584 stop:3636 length:1053 start_codon:yes stop_codon:yes gene_type:complete